MSSILVRNAVPADAQAIFELSCAVYGDTVANAGENYIPAQSLFNHIKRFPDGVFVADNGEQLVGFAITLRTSHSPYKTPKTWKTAIGGLELKGHDPRGSWLYGVDFGVHRDFRKMGIGSRLYRARFDMIRRLNLKGFYAGGMLAGYKHHYQQMSLEDYVKQVRLGTIVDPTITMQMNRGFKPGPVIPNYCGASPVDNSAMQIIWNNQAYS